MVAEEAVEEVEGEEEQTASAVGEVVRGRGQGEEMGTSGSRWQRA